MAPEEQASSSATETATPDQPVVNPHDEEAGKGKRASPADAEGTGDPKQARTESAAGPAPAPSPFLSRVMGGLPKPAGAKHDAVPSPPKPKAAAKAAPKPRSKTSGTKRVR